MNLFIGLLAVATAILLTFADRIIEHFSPKGNLAKMADETDHVMETIEDQDDQHEGK